MRLFGRIGQALIEAKQAGRDPFAAIEAVMSWDAFAESVTEAQRLAQPGGLRFPAPHRRELRHAAPLRAGISRRAQVAGRARRQGRTRRHRGAAQHEQRQRPQGAHRRADRVHQAALAKLVMTDTGIDRRYYELCALSELKNALRSGDIWVQGSRQFKDFEDYLVPPAKFASLKAGQRIAAGRGHRLRPVPA